MKEIISQQHCVLDVVWLVCFITALKNTQFTLQGKTTTTHFFVNIALKKVKYAH